MLRDLDDEGLFRTEEIRAPEALCLGDIGQVLDELRMSQEVGREIAELPIERAGQGSIGATLHRLFHEDAMDLVKQLELAGVVDETLRREQCSIRTFDPGKRLLGDDLPGFQIHDGPVGRAEPLLVQRRPYLSRQRVGLSPVVLGHRDPVCAHHAKGGPGTRRAFRYPPAGGTCGSGTRGAHCGPVALRPGGVAGGAPRGVATSRSQRRGCRPHSECARVVGCPTDGKVIMGTHGGSGMTHLLLGCVAQNVHRYVQLPVALVK